MVYIVLLCCICCSCRHSLFLRTVNISIYHRWFCVNNRLWFRIKDYSIINQKVKYYFGFDSFSVFSVSFWGLACYFATIANGIKWNETGKLVASQTAPNSNSKPHRQHTRTQYDIFIYKYIYIYVENISISKNPTNDTFIFHIHETTITVTTMKNKPVSIKPYKFTIPKCILFVLVSMVCILVVLLLRIIRLLSHGKRERETDREEERNEKILRTAKGNEKSVSNRETK